MHEIAIFYPDSNKRSSGETLCNALCCKARGCYVFKEPYSALVASMDSISGWLGDTGGEAAIYYRSLDGDFLVSLEILHTILEISYKL